MRNKKKRYFFIETLNFSLIINILTLRVSRKLLVNTFITNILTLRVSKKLLVNASIINVLTLRNSQNILFNDT